MGDKYNQEESLRKCLTFGFTLSFLVLVYLNVVTRFGVEGDVRMGEGEVGRWGDGNKGYFLMYESLVAIVGRGR